MNVSLIKFDYYFTLTGNSGGLTSMDLKFEPRFSGQRKPEDLKKAARRCIDIYTKKLDLLYQEAIDGKKEPILNDFSFLTSSGYRYKGYITQDGLRVLEERLRTLFGAEAVDPRGEISVHERQDVTVQCSFRKSEKGFDNVSVDVKFNMSHVLNVCFFQFTKQLQEIEVEKGALTDMAQLEKTLKATSGREDMDYYNTLTLTGTLDPGSHESAEVHFLRKDT